MTFLNRIYLLGLLTVLGVCLVFYYSNTQGNNLEDQVEYEQFLKEHPYYRQPGTKQDILLNEEKKRDRPDLRMRQDFLMTLDPALKRPAPERLPAIRLAAKNAKLFGTLPGEASAPWEERGPNNVAGRTRALMWDPNDADGKKVWAGGVSGGLWFNEDITSSGSSWISVDDFWDNLAITSLAYDPNDFEVFYAGTGEGWYNADAVRGQGVWRTTDGGTSWHQMESSKDFYFVNDIKVRNASGSSELYVAVVRRSNEGNFAGSSEGLYKSTDGGVTFDQVLPNVPGKGYAPGVSDIEIAADGTLWIGTLSASQGQGGGMILKSADGEEWTTVYTSTSNGRVELAAAPSADTVVYALIEKDSKIFEMKRTADAGASWVDMSMPDDDDNGIEPEDFTRSQAWYDLISAVDPARDSTVIIGAINLHMSTDAGQTWQQISKWSNNASMGNKPYSYVHADQHAIVYKPGSSSEVVFGTDGGVFWSDNITQAANSGSIKARNKEYNVTQFYAAAIHPDRAKNYFLAGAQDNGTQRFLTENINSTDEVFGGDGGYCFIDQTDSDLQIVSYTNNNYYFTTNNLQGLLTLVEDDETGHFINPADYDDEQNILYSSATESSIGRFVKGGNSFTRSDLTIELGTMASHLRVSPHTRTSTTLFVGTAAGKVFKVSEADSAAPVIEEITGSDFPGGWVSCIEIGQDEDHLLVTFSNYGVTSVWYTANGGSSWSPREGDLPDMPVRWALFNPTNYDEVILATEMGIWGTKSISGPNPSWAQFSNGLANVRVDMLQIRQSDYEVIAATHGRGLFSSSVFVSQASLKAEFVAKNRSIETGGTVSFIDRSIGAVAWQWTFEGGTPATSTTQNPSVIYASDGVYKVVLKASGVANSFDTKTVEGYINVGALLSPDGCVGRSTVDDPVGSISDGSGGANYGNELDCEWLIQPPGATSIALSFSAFDVEEGYDFLYVYEGEEADQSKIIAELTGGSLPDNITVQAGAVLLQFVTDQDVVAAGWELNFESDGLLPPTNLTALAVSDSEVELGWSDNSQDETGFVVERSADGIDYTALPVLAIDATTVTDTGLDGGTSYFYRVRALKGNLSSTPSNIANVTTLEKEDPDLLVSNVAFELLNNGKEIKLSSLLQNVIDEGTESSFSTSFYLSANDTFSIGDAFIGSIPTSSLGASGSLQIAEAFEMVILSPGDYFILAVVDEANEIEEQDETNNEASIPITLTEVLSVADDLKQGVKVYPNPATSVVNIEADVVQLGALEIRLSDLSGKVLRSMTTGTGGINRIDISGLPKGIYVLTLRKEGVQVAHRIIKQ